MWMNKSTKVVEILCRSPCCAFESQSSLWFLARDTIYAERAICYRPSVRLLVRLSVCLSVCSSVHTGGSVKNG